MAVWRVGIIAVTETGRDRGTISYFLRVNWPETAPPLRPDPNYRSSIGREDDPDVGAIQRGTVSEVLRTKNVFNLSPNAPPSEALNELQTLLEAEWTAENDQAIRAGKLSGVINRIWDGTDWERLNG